MIYLDYSANTPADSRVLGRFCEVERSCPGNANSRHQAGRDAKLVIDHATQSIAGLLSAQPAEVIYTSGASEANNFALKGLAKLSRHLGKHIISTPLEHSSVSGTLTALQEQGYEIDLVDIRRDGTIDLEHLKELLRPDTIAVAVTLVDSELGVVQPVKEISEILQAWPNCHLHVDATQAVGKIPVSFEGVDSMSLTAHKFYGLNGIGLLIKRRNLALEPLIHGGESTTIYRSGTPTVALASSLAINPNTIQRAYAQLEMEGYVYSVAGRGTFVAEGQEQNLVRRREVEDKVQGLDAGANDYLAKPFHLAELEARIRSLTLRQFTQQDVLLSCGGLTFDTRSRTATVNGQTLTLTRKETGILEYLMVHQGRPVSQEELMDHVWDNSVDSFSNSIRVHISALRKKLRAALGYDPIRNRIGEGYLMGGEEV